MHNAEIVPGSQIPAQKKLMQYAQKYFTISITQQVDTLNQ